MLTDVKVRSDLSFAKLPAPSLEPYHPSLERPLLVAQAIQSGAADLRMIAPGAVAAPSLDFAGLILDPDINFVKVERQDWIESVGNKIAAGFAELIARSGGRFGPHYHWMPHIDPRRLDDALLTHLPAETYSDRFEDFRRDFFEDSILLRSTLECVTEAKDIISRFRFEVCPSRLNEHTDSQCITFACTYYNGATVCRLQNGSIEILKPVEVGIWKGSMWNDDVYEPGTEKLLKEGDGTPINPGQELWHWAPTAQESFPRYIVLHDVEDLIIPPLVGPSLKAWI